MYKLTRPDGFDFYSGTVNYRDAIGTTIRVTDFDPPKTGSCGKGLHASRNPNDCFVGAKIPCAAFRVKGVQKIAGDKNKSRYQALKVIEEIKDLDKLFGWKYTEAIDPIHPFKTIPPEITDRHIEILKQWDYVRASVRASVRYSVRDYVWDSVRDSVWDSVWDSMWGYIGDYVRDSVRDSVWAYVGSLFPNVKKWKYINHVKGEYPFQPSVDLWRAGLVPSFDGTTWRLHGGQHGEVLWEGNLR